jgi:WD40 repeat protein
MTKRRPGSIRQDHRLLGHAGLAWQQASGAVATRYGLRHGVAHLLAAGEIGEATALGTDLSAQLQRRANEGVDTHDIGQWLRECAALEKRSDAVEAKAWADFSRVNHIFLRGTPRRAEQALLQLALDTADDSPLTLAAERLVESGHITWPWCRWLDRPAKWAPSPIVSTMSPHRASMGVLGRSFLRPPLAVLDERRILSCATDGTVCLSDLETGSTVMAWEGHSDAAGGVKVLRSGAPVSWGEDGTVRIWDMRTGEAAHTLRGGHDAVLGVEELPDGRLLAWGDTAAREGLACIWDVAAERVTASFTFERVTYDYGSVVVLEDGNILTCSWGLELWDGRTGASLSRFRDVPGSVPELTPDGRYLVSRSSGNTLVDGRRSYGNIFDVVIEAGEVSLVKRRPLAEPPGVPSKPGSGVERIVVLEEIVVALLKDPKHSIYTWRLSDAAPLGIMRGHTGRPRGALLTADGRLVSWGDDDLPRLWNPITGEALGVFYPSSRGIHGAIPMSATRLPRGASPTSASGTCDAPSRLRSSKSIAAVRSQWIDSSPVRRLFPSNGKASSSRVGPRGPRVNMSLHGSSKTCSSPGAGLPRARPISSRIG